MDLFAYWNQKKCGGWENWWSVKLSLMLWQKHTATGLVLCFPADILLITADSRLENCRSWMPLSECVQSQMRRGEVSSLLVRAWVEADPIFPMRLCQFYPPPLLLFLLLLPIQLQYLAPVNSFALTNNAQQDTLFALIRSQSLQLHGGGPQTTTEEICCFDVELYDRQVHISAAKVQVSSFFLGN